MYGEKPDYINAISSYQTYMKHLPQEKITSEVIYNLARMYYSSGTDQSTKADLKKGILQKADSLFAQVATLEPTNYRGNVWRARTNVELDPELTLGLSKPYYELTLTLVESKADVKYNPVIIECSRYLGYYYFLKKDYAESKIYWNKILVIDPKNDTALKAIDGIDKSLKGKK
jgi:tetratricopeptide (TPR) repeat protein